MHLEDVIRSVNGTMSVDGIDLDFSKTFDRVTNKRLVEKLKSMKINEWVVVWVENLL